MNTPAILALEDGTLFRGRSIGVDGAAVGEVCFNTAMTGYPEILTDPSYHGRLVTLTYPHAGNAGMTAIDFESAAAQAGGLIVRDLSSVASSWRAEQSLPDYLRANGVVAISDIDTRQLTRILREGGAQRGCIMTGEVDADEALARARAFGGLQGVDLSKVVSTREPYSWRRGSWQVADGRADSAERDPATLRFHVVALDYGIKRSTLRQLVDVGCRITVMPAQSSAAEVLALQPDGVLLSGGPSDPAACDYAIEAIRELVERGMPTFGLCQGYALLALASGARTAKMKLGHYGANHPVIDLGTRRVMISSQSHGFLVEEASLPETLRATHRSLFDGTLQGIERTDRPAFGFQGYPEASSNPNDLPPLFARFLELMAQAN
ncbi:MAG TPA: glutamine-hydrolyzing carbamoyl-phosphate synthase small subunit [Gammaproteobacteria bacterium]|nr:glutamine-hydrolyzing carbamoyl-phosphate synthase small subunit [Gammaproteobacteria bacterium]